MNFLPGDRVHFNSEQLKLNGLFVRKLWFGRAEILVIDVKHDYSGTKFCSGQSYKLKLSMLEEGWLTSNKPSISRQVDMIATEKTVRQGKRPSSRPPAPHSSNYRPSSSKSYHHTHTTHHVQEERNEVLDIATTALFIDGMLEESRPTYEEPSVVINNFVCDETPSYSASSDNSYTSDNSCSYDSDSSSSDDSSSSSSD
jgi:hypothetical protein